MAEGIKLLLTFDTANDSVTAFTFPYVSSSVTETQIKTLANTIIANKEIFDNPPTALRYAKAITTSETVYNILS